MIPNPFTMMRRDVFDRGDSVSVNGYIGLLEQFVLVRSPI
jgi:hypothetical protein